MDEIDRGINMLSKKLIHKSIYVSFLILIFLIYALNVSGLERQIISNKTISYIGESNGSVYKEDTWTNDSVSVSLSSSDTGVIGYQYSDLTLYTDKTVIDKYSSDLVYSNENVVYLSETDKKVQIPDQVVNKLVTMDRGTFVMDFYYQKHSSSRVSSLIGVGDVDTGNNHFNIFVDYFNNRLGYQFRINDEDLNYADIILEENKLYSLALQSTPDFGHRLFLDGDLLLEVPISSTNPYRYLNDLIGVDSGYLGFVKRNANNGYDLKGGLNSVKIYDTVIPSDDLKQATDNDPNDWTDIISNQISIDGPGEFAYYFREIRNVNNVTKNPSPVYFVKIDKESPSVDDIIITETTTKANPSKIEVEIDASDLTSGIERTEYQFKGLTDTIDPAGWLIYDQNNKPMMDKFFNGSLIARAIDFADNMSLERSSSDVQVGVLSVSAPVSMFFVGYDVGSGPEFSSPEYKIINDSEWGINVSLERVQKNPGNNLKLSVNQPNSYDEIKLTLSPGKGFHNDSEIIIEDGVSGHNFGNISGLHGNNIGVFNLEAVLNNELSSVDEYRFDYDFVFKFSPLGSAGATFRK